MKISIIIPCYNSEKYLGACMDSVLKQTFEDFEAILIDDGSRDNTLAIAQSYAQKDSRVRVYAKENGGVAAARNLGLDNARGEWITFVDSDDLLPEDALSSLLSGASETVDMVVCAHETFDERGRRETVIPETRWMDKQGEAMRCAAALRLIEGDSVLNIMCNKLHRRALIEREGLRLRPGVKIAEDALFNLEAVLCGRGIAYVNRVAYAYRTHSASAMHTQTQSEMQRHMPWLEAMRDMLLRRGQMEAYFPAYVDSAALRLYKDGGVVQVVRRFQTDALPLLPLDAMDTSAMGIGARMLLALCRAGAYPFVYPLIYPLQVLRRKISQAAFALRAQKEMPQ
ncbi:MAG: glycosyltransferase [Clostridia bacterium]|nr:glycosyltransferase [Clostridia bacterium]